MNCLDKLIDILYLTEEDCDDDSGEASQKSPTGLLAVARQQLGKSRINFWEDSPGTFHACGVYCGCGYATCTVVVDPLTAETSVRIDTNLRVSHENIGAARKLCRRISQDLVVPGLTIEDDGQLVFATERVYQVTAVDELVSKAFSTVHRNAHMVAQIEAGVPIWDVLATLK